MLRLIFLVTICLNWTALAVAKELPSFLKETVYSTDPSKCGDVTEDDSLQLSKEGIFGLEFACTFLGFQMDKDADTGEVYLAVAQANCGDDSGINRPDLVTLIHNKGEESVTVQSQNDYVLTELMQMMSARLEKPFNPETDALNYVSREYRICQ